MIRSVNPFNGELLAEFEQATSGSIDKALDSGEKAFRKWKITTFPQRSDVLRACSRVLLDDKAKYASLISHEMGKVWKESVAEVEKMRLGMPVLCRKRRTVSS